MTTPIQRSEQKATQSGIQALESAKSSIQRIQSQVDSTRGGLAPGYGGQDGKGFQDLLMRWDQRCQSILGNLQNVIEALNHQAQGENKVQGNAMDGIAQANRTAGAGGRSDSAFHTLAG